MRDQQNLFVSTAFIAKKKTNFVDKDYRKKTE